MPCTGRPAVPGGRTVAGDFEIIEARPGAEIQYRALAGAERPRGGYYLSTEGGAPVSASPWNGNPRGSWAG